MVLITSAICSLLVTLSVKPWPEILLSFSVLEIAAAPLSLVAVPITVAPALPKESAMA